MMNKIHLQGFFVRITFVAQEGHILTVAAPTGMRDSSLCEFRHPMWSIGHQTLATNSIHSEEKHAFTNEPLQSLPSTQNLLSSK